MKTSAIWCSPSPLNFRNPKWLPESKLKYFQRTNFGYLFKDLSQTILGKDISMVLSILHSALLKRNQLIILSTKSLFIIVTLTMMCCKSNHDAIPDNAACKTIKETYKTALIPLASKQLAETINLNGKQYEVALHTTRVFSYDTMDRLIKEEFSQWDKSYGSALYKYQSNSIIVTNTFHNGSTDKVSVVTDTLELNSQGLAKKQGGNLVVYDENGFPKALGNPAFQNYIVERGNIKQIIYNNWTGEGGKLSVQYEYDTARMNIPLMKPFLGKLSNNLPVILTYVLKGSGHYMDGPNYQVLYNYSFDKYRRVSRRIALSKRLHDLWDLELDRGGIGVTDFEYKCK